MERTEHLLFTSRAGEVGRKPAGLLVNDNCLPIAASVDGESSPNGLHAAVEACVDSEELFRSVLGLDHVAGPGLWVVTVRFDDDDIDLASESEWDHLAGGAVRRPTTEELEPLARGEAPWGGKLL